jgi:hypothetical protein
MDSYRHVIVRIRGRIYKLPEDAAWLLTKYGIAEPVNETAMLAPEEMRGGQRERDHSRRGRR